MVVLGPVEPGEDQIEPDFEAAFVSVRLHVLHDVLDEVRVLVGRQRPQEVRREAWELVHLVREAQLLERVPEDVGLQNVVRVIRQILGQARLAQRPEHPVCAA